MDCAKSKYRLGGIFTKENLKAFYMGKYYPIFVCVIVLFGYLTGTELYLNAVHLLVLSIGLCLVDSLRPLVTALCTFVFQISREHTPADFSIEVVEANNYYFEGARGVIFVLSFVPPLIGIIVFFIKNKLINRKALGSLPMLIPSGVLTIALLLGGAFSGAWNGASLVYSLATVLVWFIVPYLFILGFKKDNSKELLNYFVYLASIITVILIVEVLFVYLSTDGLITESGSIDRSRFAYGWGNCNTGAQALTVLIPILFIGATKGENKKQIYYFAMATIALLGIILNVSRTGLLVGGLTYAACALFAFIKSDKKKRFLIEAGIVLAGVVTFAALFGSVMLVALENYIERGIDDSGRTLLWSKAIEAFCESPIFGKGFFGLYPRDPTDVLEISSVAFLPKMAHNTVCQLLGSLGIVGLLAYVFYRACSLRPFFRKPTYSKSMIGIAMLTVLAGSLLDNFVFYILPMVNYAVLYAILYKMMEEDGEERRSLLF